MSGKITPADVPYVYSRLARATEEVRFKKEKQNLDSRDASELTDWKQERPNLSVDFPSSSRLFHDLVQQATVEHIPGSSQEFIIVGELLTVLTGGESTIIQLQDLNDKFGGREFVVSSTVEKLNAEFIKKFLPMVSYYSIVVRFIEENGRLNAGRVNQALADEMDKQLNEYLQFVLLLTSKHRGSQLHLHELWYCIQNSFTTLKLLSDIAKEVSRNDSKGGRTLSLLHDYLTHKVVSVNTEHFKICKTLLIYSAKPYMESVQQWIFNGVIYDPFDEFMIVENPKWKKKDYSEGYWELMYQLRPHFVPNFLEDVQFHVLNAGKYLNVIRECVSDERDMKFAEIQPLFYCSEKSYNKVIINAYQFSSKNLLDYMLNEHSLIERVTIAKRYFLLQQGDFVVQVLDTCHEELDKNVNDVMPSRLAALVEMAIRLTSTRNDPYTEQFTSCLKPLDLGSQVKKILVDCIRDRVREDLDSSSASDHVETLSGYESFMLTMKSEWPVSLVFNSKVQSVYQMLFRHLFYCKYVERLLNNTWILVQPLKKGRYQDIRLSQSAIALRNKMSFFLQNIEYYMMEEAIEPAWEDFLRIVPTCESMDDLMKFHWAFLEKCTQDCLLTNLELLSIFRLILSICKEFCDSMVEIPSVEKYPNFPERISYFEEQFNDSLLLLLSKITHLAEDDRTGKLLNLFNRQNFNHFYDSALKDADIDTLADSLKFIG